MLQKGADINAKSEDDIRPYFLTQKIVAKLLQNYFIFA